jgi:hypothetical protein
MKFIFLRPVFSIWDFIRYQFGLKVMSVAIAVALWVVVFGSQTIEITKEVPFEAVVNDEQILVDPVPEKITFKLSGPKAFLRTLSNRIEDPIRANIKTLKAGSFTHRIFSDAIKLPLGVKVQSITPNVIQLHVEELKKKSVPIKLTVTGNVPEGLKVLRMELNPSQIRVKGPKNRISSLSAIATIPIDLSAIHDTSIIPLAFDFKMMGVDPDGVMPELNIEIQGKGQAFRVRHVPLKIKSTGKAKSSDEEVTVIVRTDPSESTKIDGDQISALIDVRDMPEGEFVKWVKVQLPEKVHLVRVIPPLTRVVVKGQ